MPKGFGGMNGNQNEEMAMSNIFQEWAHVIWIFCTIIWLGATFNYSVFSIIVREIGLGLVLLTFMSNAALFGSGIAMTLAVAVGAGLVWRGFRLSGITLYLLTSLIMLWQQTQNLSAFLPLIVFCIAAIAAVAKDDGLKLLRWE
jgi:hypothetical protein